MLKEKIIFKVFILSIMIVACSVNNTTPGIKDLIFPSHCTNACWTGIEPEVTNKEQTLSILTKKYGVENVDSENFDNQTRFINWMTSQQDLSVGGTVSLIDNTVEDI